MKARQSEEISVFIANLRNSIWVLGIPSFLFGVTDRGVAALADGYVSFVELFHVFATSFLLISWLYLKPEKNLILSSANQLQEYGDDLTLFQNEAYLLAAQSRMLELQKYHLVNQKYVLPLPYVCQVYHLLNLKHLETVHHFSLNNLKVIGINSFQPTALGGAIKFQTVMDSPVSILKLWRQPIVEVDLILHSPYTVELSIPVYNNKKIVVLFNALPLSDNRHVLLIDIYSNLNWPRFLLQIMLHVASYLTLYEDLPYLRQLAKKNLTERETRGSKDSNKSSSCKTMWLFRRFVDLYGPQLNQLHAASELKQIVGAEV